MRIVRRAPTVQPVAPNGTVSQLMRGNPSERTEWILDSGGQVTGACVRCEERWCAQFPEVPVGRLQQATSVCPVQAINFTDDGEARISDACIGCGVCVLRCPYGGLALQAGQASVVSPGEDYDLSDAERVRALADTPVDWQWDDAHRQEFIGAVVEGLADERRDSYYGLVARLLTSSGLTTDVSPGGQNPSRFDAVVVHPEFSIPIEIKSPREEPFPGIKAIEQALENKVLLDASFASSYPSHADAATLAVGHELPPLRSDVAELINDIKTAFEINVAVLSLPQLYEWFIACVTTKEPLSIDDLAERRSY